MSIVSLLMVPWTKNDLGYVIPDPVLAWLPLVQVVLYISSPPKILTQGVLS